MSGYWREADLSLSKALYSRKGSIFTCAPLCFLYDAYIQYDLSLILDLRLVCQVLPLIQLRVGKRRVSANLSKSGSRFTEKWKSLAPLLQNVSPIW
jgi:hypothetical protein